MRRFRQLLALAVAASLFLLAVSGSISSSIAAYFGVSFASSVRMEQAEVLARQLQLLDGHFACAAAGGATS